jgi:hypothetical protein
MATEKWLLFLLVDLMIGVTDLLTATNGKVVPQSYAEKRKGSQRIW